MNVLSLSFLILSTLVGQAPAAPVRVEVPLVGTNGVDLADVVAALARASALDVARPPSGVTLPVLGLTAPLSLKTIGDTLGPGTTVGVEGRTFVVALDPSLLTANNRAAWEGRIRSLATRAEQEAKRRERYGIHALPSYKPNDPTRPTVCLVHGVNSSTKGFVHLIPELEKAGYGVVSFDYPYNRNLDESAGRFARDWAAFRRQSGETLPWSIVAHSMGTLVARDYIEGPAFNHDVSTFVMVAPVNQGSSLAKTQTLMQMIKGVQAVNGRKSNDALASLGDGLGEAANDMSPGSDYLKTLNARPRRNGVDYHILAGDSGFIPREVRRQIDRQLDAVRGNMGFLGGMSRFAIGGDLTDRLDEVTDGKGDGCVSVSRTRLIGAPEPVVIHANHAELIRAPLIFADPGPVACMPYLLRWLPKPSATKPSETGRDD